MGHVPSFINYPGSEDIPEERPTLKSIITYELMKMEIGSFPTNQQWQRFRQGIIGPTGTLTDLLWLWQCFIYLLCTLFTTSFATLTKIIHPFLGGNYPPRALGSPCSDMWLE